MHLPELSTGADVLPMIERETVSAGRSGMVGARKMIKSKATREVESVVDDAGDQSGGWCQLS